MVYKEHFRQYVDPVHLEDRASYARERAGVDLLKTCNQVNEEALPLLAPSMEFHMRWDADDASPTGHHSRYLDVANRLSIVGRKISNRIGTMRLDVYIDMECAAFTGVNWTGLRTMENLRRLDVAFYFPHELQAIFCMCNYGRLLFLTTLIEGLVGSLPAQCVLRWLLSGVGSCRDIGHMFVPPNLPDLRRSINPYMGGSSTKSGIEIFLDS